VKRKPQIANETFAGKLHRKEKIAAVQYETTAIFLSQSNRKKTFNTAECTKKKKIIE